MNNNNLENRNSAYKREKTMDEQFRQHFFIKKEKSNENRKIKEIIKQMISTFMMNPQIFSLQQKFFDIKTQAYECQFITINGSYNGFLKIIEKHLLFCSNLNCVLENSDMYYGVPVLFLKKII